MLSGFTLVELLVTVAVIATIAGFVVVRLGSTHDDAKVRICRATLAAIRDAITGTAGAPGFETDLREPPLRIADLFTSPALLPSGRSVASYDPVVGRGWNGPYLVRDTGTYALDIENGFRSDYGSPGDRAVMDPWGHPVVLQWPHAESPSARREYLRVVSAGPDGLLQTPLDLVVDIHDLAQVGDDLVVYLHRANGP